MEEQCIFFLFIILSDARGRGNGNAVPRPRVRERGRGGRRRGKRSKIVGFLVLKKQKKRCSPDRRSGVPIKVVVLCGCRQTLKSQSHLQHSIHQVHQCLNSGSIRFKVPELIWYQALMWSRRDTRLASSPLLFLLSPFSSSSPYPLSTYHLLSSLFLSSSLLYVLSSSLLLFSSFFSSLLSLLFISLPPRHLSPSPICLFPLFSSSPLLSVPLFLSPQLLSKLHLFEPKVLISLCFLCTTQFVF